MDRVSLSRFGMTKLFVVRCKLMGLLRSNSICAENLILFARRHMTWVSSVWALATLCEHFPNIHESCAAA